MHEPVAPTVALKRLQDGNRRFAEGRAQVGYAADRRSTAAQRPFAIVVGCSDSRVPVEVVFDAGLGELFVVRTAGHVLAEASLASVRYAVQVLDVRAIVVLGHEDCGAVSAALTGDAPAWLEPITGHIDVAGVTMFDAPPDADDPLLAAAVDEHVRDTVRELRNWVDKAGITEEPLVFGAAYKLASGEVHWLD